jgi:hypothetical protein
MLTVTESCCCGAQITLSDSIGLYITIGGEQDKNGDKFVWQKSLREFRERHRTCARAAERQEEGK